MLNALGNTHWLFSDIGFNIPFLKTPHFYFPKMCISGNLCPIQRLTHFRPWYLIGNYSFFKKNPLLIYSLTASYTYLLCSFHAYHPPSLMPLPSAKAPFQQVRLHYHGFCVTLFWCDSLSLTRAIPLFMYVELSRGAWVTQWTHLYLTQRFLSPQSHHLPGAAGGVRPLALPPIPWLKVGASSPEQPCVGPCTTVTPWVQCGGVSRSLCVFLLLPIVEFLHFLCSFFWDVPQIL